jgi:beta-glucosidase
MSRLTFPEKFIWGSATASFQIEGAAFEDGKGESIWDRFSHIPGRIADGNNGDVACDHYHRLEEDLRLMKELGLTSYRFSISWPRVIPEGRGGINDKGLDFYKRLIDLLNRNSIAPAVTLYHWDLPQKLQDIGGWANRDVVDYFQDYAAKMFQSLGAAVPLWITHNEPSVAAFIGNWEGRHAPGLRDFSTALLVSHHLLLSHGKAVQAHRQSGLKSEIGITLSLTPMRPASERAEDVAAAGRNDGYWNRWFLDPVFKGRYPADMVEWYSERVPMPDLPGEDLKLIGAPIDFLGVNNYYTQTIDSAPDAFPLELRERPTGEYRTEMGWGINPDGFYDLLLRLDRDYPGVKIILTENGASFRDMIDRSGRVRDENRIDFLYRYLTSVHRAIADGVDIRGYYIWTLMDNFEWAWGCAQRFGLAYTDYRTQERIIKDSGRWYAEVIRENGFEAP